MYLVALGVCFGTLPRTGLTLLCKGNRITVVEPLFCKIDHLKVSKSHNDLSVNMYNNLP